MVRRSLDSEWGLQSKDEVEDETRGGQVSLGRGKAADWEGRVTVGDSRQGSPPSTRSLILSILSSL
jgi:hypothetical protein